MGSLAQDLEIRAKKTVKAINWRKHKSIIENYWVEIDRYWKNKDVFGFKIFQDAMATNGMVGQKIVVDLAKKGSMNYKIVKQLMKKGAQLVKTEDPDLLKEEYFLTKELVKRKSLLAGLFAFLRYKWRKGGLLAKRDSYIAKRIDESLQEGEIGVCFLGARHQVLPILSKDIMVITLKNPEKVKEYYQKFTTQKWEGKVNDLSRYLTAPIRVHLGKKYDHSTSSGS